MARLSYDVANYNLIYIYKIDDDAHKGLLKIGETTFYSRLGIAQILPNSPVLNSAAHKRILEQTKTALIKYELLYTELATKKITMNDGSQQDRPFSDHDVHDVILKSGFRAITFTESGRKSEWFEIDLDSAIKSISAVKEGRDSLFMPKATATKTTQPKIKLRFEQEENVEYTIKMFKKYDSMLWNCKMRYGKTVTAYELIKREGYKKVIVITHRPAVEDGWGDDHKLMFCGINHDFIDKTNGSVEFDSAIDAENDTKLQKTIQSGTPFVYFASIQDLRGSQRVGGKYNKNNAVFDTDWDLLIVDEAHEGTATDLGDAVIKTIRKQNTKLLLLSGTPYNMMSEFDENKYTWTYADEQKAKKEWEENHPFEKNPYEELPKMNIFTFNISERISHSYRYVTEDSAFNFREFFRTWTGDKDKDYREIPEGYKIGDFVHEDDVNGFLTLISADDNASNYPFASEEYREMFAHTFWIVPGVREAKALSTLIQNHPNFKEFEVVNIAGDGDEEKPYNEALALVRSSIKSYPRTITISCGKLTTGVTVREWTAIMMLSGSASTSATGYMQAIFRVQSPGVINGKQKQNCYVFDFAPDRTLQVVVKALKSSSKGGSDESTRKALGEFINFCPIIAVEGTEMRTYDVDEMMRQIKRISVENAINSGFDDDTIYVSDAGMNFSDIDKEILRKLSDVVNPKKKGQHQNNVDMAQNHMTDEQRKLAKEAQHKPKKELTEEEKKALELYKEQKEAQKKLFNLLRAVSIRLPLLFYGVDADITEIIHLNDFISLVDEESWKEFMPKDLTTDLFRDIMRYYDEDVVVGAGLRIRKLAKAADELPPTYRAKRIVEIISKFKNPDKETVLTPWRVVNMHMGNTIGGYNFYDDTYQKEIDEPRFIENGNVTEDVFLNENAKVLEMNSKSGLYPLYLAYTFYMLNVSGKEKDLTLEEAQKIWFDVLDKHIYVLCKTDMARTITIRTLAGYSEKPVHARCLPHLIDSWMKDIPRLANKLTNPETWGQGGERMKFDAVVGNPPYNVGNQQIYVYFYLASRKVTNNYLSLIFPSSWQPPKMANGLDKLNTPEIKADPHIVFIDNRHNVFPGITGAEWTNIILWQKNYDNGLDDGYQNIYTNGENLEIKKLIWDFNEIEKPNEIIEAFNHVKEYGDFTSIQTITSQRRPYGLDADITDVIAPFKETQNNNSIVIYAKNKTIYYVNTDFKLPKISPKFKKYKIFVPKAWGNMSEGYLGGAYSDIIIGKPNEACTETYLESGYFDDFAMAKKHAKYLLTNFVRALFFLNKFSQNSTRSWGAVPMQDYSEPWWNLSIAEINEKLFDKYNIPQNVRDFINKNIQTKTEANIVNFE